ncbi:MAG TPA: chemotaxis response regulator protein-glutamate methylesterase [Gammaproteobacteria bacterium]|nr:chemotaxis response regulator protein-glutamate methylesterase [Gammaproteobacteria bacterium]
MTTRVLVVDDSGFFRRRVAEMLEADPLIKVIGMAENGDEAVKKAAELKPDVITMDIEMPVLDGISATRKIMRQTPTQIIMFSSLTTEGAKATLDALEAGAVDFMPKRFEDIARDRDEVRKLLCQRVRALGSRCAIISPRATPASARAASPTNKLATSHTGLIKLVAIGTSTGGPVALQKVLMRLPKNFSVPILLVQHMPASFTQAFAKRLDQMCAIEVRQAEDKDSLRPGVALLAPGGRQMRVEGRPGNVHVRISDETGLTYKPSVDITFSSIANVYPKDTLAIIMTGMGADGREGAKTLKQRGSEIWAQDEASSVIYGMPAAVVSAGLASKVLSLDDIGPGIVKRL